MSTYHRVGRAPTSDRLEDTFVMVVYEKKMYSCFGQKILTKP